jgi:hypothetical protein
MQKKQSHLEGLFALVLFGVFASCVLSVLLTGAGAYRRLTHRDQVAYECRTAIQYLATKVRQAPTPQSVGVDCFGSGDCLTISEEIDGQPYLTRIYCYDGWLRELFSGAQVEFLPEDGEPVLPAQSLSLTLEESALSIELNYADAAPSTLTLSIRGGQEGLP